MLHDPMWDEEPTEGDAFVAVTRRPANGHRSGVRFVGFKLEEVWPPQRTTFFKRGS